MKPLLPGLLVTRFAFPIAFALLAASPTWAQVGAVSSSEVSVGSDPSPKVPAGDGEYTDCVPAHTPLVFDGGYGVSLCYKTAEGVIGEAHGGIWASGQSGLLWFFDRDNVEVLVKVLDGCSHNGRRWVFVAPVTDVAFNLHVTSSSGRKWTHRNRLGETAATRSDTSAFVCAEDDAKSTSVAAGRRPNTGTGQALARTPISKGEYTNCRPTATPLVFDGDYRVSLCFETADGEVREARGGIWASDQSGLLWFFSRDNAEVLVKVLDGCSHNGSRWIFVAPVTDVAFNLHVTSVGGREWTHRNRLGETAATRSDTSAFDCATDDGVVPGAVHIPDANLRAALEVALGLPSGEPVTRGALETLTVLDAPRTDIRDLTGLELATGLSRLTLVGNSINDLSPLAGLTELTYLALSWNDIEDVSPLAGLTELEHLLLEHNVVEDLRPLAGLANLKTLYLARNVIKDVRPLAGLAELEVLRLDFNVVEDLRPLAGLTSLRHLNLAFNAFGDVSPLSALVALRGLGLWGNLLEDVAPLSGLNELHALDLGTNMIDDVSPLRRLTNLVILDLKSNRLEDLWPLAGLTKLKHVELSVNEIQDVSPLTGLLEIRTLGLEFNVVEDISPLVDLQELERLDLRGNPLDRESVEVRVPDLLQREVDVRFDWFKRKRDFDIDLVFLEDFSDAQKRLVEWAARRWMSVLPEDLPDVVRDQALGATCGGIQYEIPAGERIDDLRVYVRKSFDPWLPRGRAGGRSYRDDDGALPFAACLHVNLSYEVSDTAVHELAHALGFSRSAPGWRRFLQSTDDGHWHFGGPLAIAAFKEAGGADYAGPGVPLRRQDASHWGGPIADELMGYQRDERKRRLSAITIQALADIGYSVDLTQADEYSLPDPLASGHVRGTASAEIREGLRAEAWHGAGLVGGRGGECAHGARGGREVAGAARGESGEIEGRQRGSL